MAAGEGTLRVDKHGMGFVVLTRGADHAATVYEHGAHVTSWVCGGEERLFMSAKAVWKPPKALRGGVPVCWPQFGDLGPCKAQHGFARNTKWTYVADASSETAAVFTLAHDPADPLQQDWPHPFQLRLEVSLQARGELRHRLTVDNTGPVAFEFTTALHTYFRTPDLPGTEVQGLRGLTYKDSLDGRAEKVDDEPAVTFGQEVDRIYLGVPPRVEMTGFTVHQEEGFADAIVWNPWVDKAKRMSDYGDEEYKQHICVESARCQTPVQLEPNSTWVGQQLLSIPPQHEGGGIGCVVS